MENPPTKEYVYGIYVRKSSEGEDRQMQSLDRQLTELKEYVQKNDLTVYPEIFEEEQSAFHPGREQFARLVKMTEQGKINAWLCWHYNRLSRNPIDAGTVVYLMDQGKLHHVRTKERTFQNTATDKFSLNLELSISKKDSDDKSHIIISGILQRHRRGYPTSKPPVGFLISDRRRGSIWEVDPHRFPLIQKVFKKFLEGKDSLRSITEYAKELGITTFTKGYQLGDRPLSLSYVHNHLLKNPVYAGFFYGRDEKRYILHEELPRVISEDDYIKIRRILGARRIGGNLKNKHAATYSGHIKSKDKRNLSAEVKFQLICDCKKKFAYLNRSSCPECGVAIKSMMNPNFLEYTYYYDYQVRLDRTKIAKMLEEKKLERKLCDYFTEHLNISSSLRDWSIKYLRELDDDDLEEHKRLNRYVSKNRSELENGKKHMKDLLMDGLVSKDDYTTKLREYENLEAQLEKKAGIEKHKDNWIAEAEHIFDMAVEFGNIMEHGDKKSRKQAVEALTLNLTWDGEKLSVTNTNPVSALIFGLKTGKEEIDNFEPTKIVANKGRKGGFEDLCPAWCTQLDAFRTLISDEKMGVVPFKKGSADSQNASKSAA